MTTNVAALSGEQLRRLLRRGKCWASDEPDRWFPPEPTSSYPYQRMAYKQEADQLCGGCPVRAACLEYALRVESRGQVPHGIWGGTAPWERRRMIAAPRAASLEWRAAG